MGRAGYFINCQFYSQEKINKELGPQASSFPYISFLEDLGLQQGREHVMSISHEQIYANKVA